MTRRTKLMAGVSVGAAIVLVGAGVLLAERAAHAEEGGANAGATMAGYGRTVVVYRSPTCGCCKAWEDHMRAAGYTIESHETTAMGAVKAEHGVPRPLQSCHTALVEGYVLEGHVPEGDVARLLAERPDIHGLAVPGMPPGSPGMDVPGREDEPFEVFAFTDAGAAEIWATR